MLSPGTDNPFQLTTNQGQLVMTLAFEQPTELTVGGFAHELTQAGIPNTEPYQRFLKLRNQHYLSLLSAGCKSIYSLAAVASVALAKQQVWGIEPSERELAAFQRCVEACNGLQSVEGVAA